MAKKSKIHERSSGVPRPSFVTKAKVPKSAKASKSELKVDAKADMKFNSTAEIKVSKQIIGQVVGQEEAVNVMKKAAKQRRHVLLIGEPGTGKSMLGLALAELLPKEKLVDTLSYPNINDENQPIIKTVPAGKGRDIASRAKIEAAQMFKNQNILMFIIIIAATLIPYYFWKTKMISDVIYAAYIITGMVFVVGFIMFVNLGKKMATNDRISSPKVIVDNYKKSQAPFFDATGAHAGALLGDVLHDPFQCFFPSLNVIKIDNNFNKNTGIELQLNSLFDKKREIIRKKERNYESIFLDRNELVVMGENNGSVSPVDVLSVNRHDYDGRMIKITTSENKEIIVTPEHKIAVWRNGKIVYIKAKDIKNDELVTKAEELIIDEQDIINTYDERQQEQCRLYHQYLEIKNKNPPWGHKKIAKAMNQPYGKTRWWHAGKHIPVPIQTANLLKQQGLLPLKNDNLKLPLIAKVLGTTFWDGGIFENLNGIFLSSSEKEAVKEFGYDLEEIFNLETSENSRIIEGGEKGHSWCYQNTNRKVIRFFLALGAPRGNKTNSDFVIPNWIYLSDEFADEFFGSLFGSELGVPKIHKQKNRLQTLDIGITGSPEFENNRLDFLNKVKRYLDYKGVETTSLLKRKTNNKNLFLYRLMISVKFDNVVNFVKNIKVNYCEYKKIKLKDAISEFKDLKKKKYEELISKGYGAEHAMNLLNLTPKSLYLILNGEEIA